MRQVLHFKLNPRINIHCLQILAYTSKRHLTWEINIFDKIKTMTLNNLVLELE
jgi:hypothetical protein